MTTTNPFPAWPPGFDAAVEIAQRSNQSNASTTSEAITAIGDDIGPTLERLTQSGKVIVRATCAGSGLVVLHVVTPMDASRSILA